MLIQAFHTVRNFKPDLHLVKKDPVQWRLYTVILEYQKANHVKAFVRA